MDQSEVRIHEEQVVSLRGQTLSYLLSYGTINADSEKKGPRFRNQVHEEISPYLLGAQDQRLGAEQVQLVCGFTGTSSGNCQETEICMVRASHTLRQPLQKPSFRWPTPWSAEEMLDGHQRRVDVCTHARTAHKGFLQRRLEADLC